MTYEELPANVQALRETMEKLPEFQNVSYKHSFDGFMKKVQQIDDFYSIGKYKIVFIGEPGKGKTTAICNWLGLLKKNKESEKRIEAISLLATASGRTTVAEVHIRQVIDSSKIRVEYMSIDQQKEYIKEYCNYYYLNGLGMTDDDANDTEDHVTVENVHLEIDRVIRNMASLETLPSKAKEHLDEKHNKIEAYLKTFKDANSFYECILEKIDLDHRQCSIVPYKGEMDFEEWLSKTFKEINDGKRSDCSIPSKIYVDIFSEDLFLALPDYIEEIIDTIGLDSSVRTDLQELMSAKDTICFLMDDLKNVPSSNIRKLIKETFLNKWDPYCPLKTSIFVKSPVKELEAVNEADGDPDAGIVIKANELKRRFDVDKIPYEMDNTLFLDSCAAYIFKPEKTPELDENGKPVINELTGKPKIKINQVIEYDNDVADEYCQRVTDEIQKTINRLKDRLQKDADIIRAEVVNLIELEHNSVNTEVDNELFQIREKVAEKKENLSKVRDMDIVEDILKKAIVDIHWKTIKKMNSLYGGYNRWHTDIYTQIKQVGKEYFLKAIGPVSSEINQLLVDVRNKEARSITNGYLNQYNLMVKEGTEKMGQSFFQWAWKEGFAPQSDANKFWCKVNSISGTGYKKRVKEQYEAEVYDGGVKLARMITEEVEETVDKLLCLFPYD